MIRTIGLAAASLFALAACGQEAEEREEGVIETEAVAEEGVTGEGVTTGEAVSEEGTAEGEAALGEMEAEGGE